MTTIIRKLADGLRADPAAFAEGVRSALRKRHGLADDAPVLLKSLAMQASVTGHTFKARITTDTLDRDGEVMVPQGMATGEFDKSGTIFWNHNYDMPIAKPVGKLQRAERYVDAAAEFAVRPADYQGEFFPDFARAMVEQGVVKGVSVGFMPLEGRPPTTKDFERYGPEVKRIWSKWKLLEWSIAPLQCNPDAVITHALQKGLITRDDARAVGVDPDAEPTEPVPDRHVVKQVPAAEPQPEVRRAVAKTVTLAPAPAPLPGVKCVHRLIRAPAVDPDAKVRRLVLAAVAKQCGRLYED